MRFFSRLFSKEKLYILIKITVLYILSYSYKNINIIIKIIDLQKMKKTRFPAEF
jgi:hypothetical protein